MKSQIILTMLGILFVFGLPVEIIAQKKKTTKAKPVAVKKSSLADDTFNQGATLFKQETVEAYQAALAKFNQALGFYQNENDAEGEADCYMIIGRIYGRLKNSKGAFDNYSKAFDIYRVNKNYEGIGQASNNLGSLARDLGDFETSAKYYQSALVYRTNLAPNVQAQILNGLGECFFALGKIDEAKNKFTEANTFWTASVKNEDKVRTTYNLGRISFYFNETEQGLNYLNKALAESRQFNNPILEGDILEELARYYNAIGDLTKAIEYRRRIFDAYSNAKAATVTVSRVLLSVNNLQVSYYRAGDFQNALQLLESGISRGQQAGEILSTAYLIGNKGVLLTDQGKYSEAMSFLNQGINASRQAGNKFSEAYYLASLGIALAETGEIEQAINNLNQALQLVPAGVEPETEGKVIAGLIAVYALAQDKNKSNEMIRLASSRNIDKGFNAGAVQVLYAAGFAAQTFGQDQQALQYFNQAFAIASKLNHEVEKNRIWVTAADSYAKIGDYQNSLQVAQKSHDFYKKIGNDWMDMKTHYQIGEAYLKLNQLQNALDNFNSAINFAQRLGDRETEILSFFGNAMTYKAGQDYKNALQNLNQALSISQQTDDRDSQKFVLTEMANLYETSGDKKKAKEFRDKAKKIKN